MKTNNNRLHLHGVLIAMSLALLVNAATADELTGSLSLGIGKSDNLQRTPDDQLDVGIAFLGGEFGYLRTGSRLNANIIANADYLTYDDNAIDEEIVGGASAFLDYALIEELFLWTLQYNYGQQVFDPLVPIRPGNREDVSFLTTGPVFSLPLGARNSLDVELGYSAVRYELRTNDNDRKSVQVGVSREVGDGRTIALIGSEEHIEFKDLVVNPDFDRRELFIRWTTLSARNNVNFDIGYSELELDGFDETNGGSVLRLDWTRVVSTSTTISLGGGSRFSDQGNIFRFGQNVRFDIRETDDVIGVATPFRSNFFNATYTLQRERTALNLIARWTEEDYEEDTTFNRDLIRLNAFLSRQLSRKVTGDLGLVYSSRDFATLDRKDDDILYQLTLGYEINPAFTTSLSFQHLDRSSTLDIDEFSENRVFLILSYIPQWSR